MRMLAGTKNRNKGTFAQTVMTPPRFEGDAQKRVVLWNLHGQALGGKMGGVLGEWEGAAIYETRIRNLRLSGETSDCRPVILGLQELRLAQEHLCDFKTHANLWYSSCEPAVAYVQSLYPAAKVFCPWRN